MPKLPPTLRLVPWLCAAAWALAMGACDDGATPPKPGGGSGKGGEGGCPYDGTPAALFTLHVAAESGPVPSDATVQVTWSAGEEPLFALGDPATWKTLDEGSNLECEVDRTAPPPTDLTELTCELWTSGATLVVVHADGFLPHEQTLTPAENKFCEVPVPSDVTLTLEVDHGQGGASGN